MRIDRYEISAFTVGDLVEFVGFHYSPEYYYRQSAERELGIIVKETNCPGLALTSNMYRVYWFKTARSSETVAGHLKLVYNKNSS
jgi:hypothetical protein